MQLYAPLDLLPDFAFPAAAEGRAGQVALEFLVASAWHDLTPSTVETHTTGFCPASETDYASTLFNVDWFAAQNINAFGYSAMSTQAPVFGSGGATSSVAETIQQGRDLGLAGYNAYRTALGLSTKTFADFPAELADHYLDVNDVDLYVGMILESDKAPGMDVSETAAYLTFGQIQKLLAEDSQYYKKLFASNYAGTAVGELLVAMDGIAAVTQGALFDRLFTGLEAGTYDFLFIARTGTVFTNPPRPVRNFNAFDFAFPTNPPQEKSVVAFEQCVITKPLLRPSANYRYFAGKVGQGKVAYPNNDDFKLNEFKTPVTVVIDCFCADCALEQCSGRGECPVAGSACACDYGFGQNDCSEHVCKSRNGHVGNFKPPLAAGICACDEYWTGTLCDSPLCERERGASSTRTYNSYFHNGACNNVFEPSQGRADALAARLVAANYADGASSVDSSLPAPAAVVADAFTAAVNAAAANGENAFMRAFAQMLLNDVADFDTTALNASGYRTGSDARNPAGFRNRASSWVDASTVYGSQQSGSIADGASSLIASSGLFNAGAVGDARANNDAVLLALHTVFVREHDYFASQISTIFTVGGFSGFMNQGQDVYYYAREAVIAEMKLLAQELLDYVGAPAVVVSSAPLDLVAAAAFSLDRVPSEVWVAADNTGAVSADSDVTTTFAAGVENIVTGALRNELPGSGSAIPAFAAADAASIVANARAMGLGSYNAYCRAFGLPVKSLGDYPVAIAALYSDVEQIDAVVGQRVFGWSNLQYGVLSGVLAADSNAAFSASNLGAMGDLAAGLTDTTAFDAMVAAIVGTTFQQVLQRSAVSSCAPPNVFKIPAAGSNDASC